MRVHVFGASGSGTTTFDRALASHWVFPHHDTDDYYWKPTNPSFLEKRLIEERLEMMEAVFLKHSNWVLSGSLVSWSESIAPYFDVAIFLSLENEERLMRIQHREEARYGKDALALGGERYETYQKFMKWNANYENETLKGRSRKLHERWIKTLDCPAIRLDSAEEVSTLVQETSSNILKKFPP